MSSDTVGNYAMASLASRANTRFQESKAENPYLYYGPVTGMVARSAGYIFAGRMFANYSKANSAGVLSEHELLSLCDYDAYYLKAKGMIKSFYAIYEEKNNFIYRKS